MDKVSNDILNGIRVLDFSRVMSGPFCTSMLADLGAEVIKIEMPEIGDEARHFGPYRDGESTYFILLNRNKKSITINLKTVEGQALIKSLVPQCDVIVENFRPGVMARLGLGEADMRSLNSTLIYTSISGFGQDSPLRNWPAFDLIIQAMSGMMSLTGPKGGPATAVGESVADVCTGMFAAFGTVSALFDRERSGRGHHVDVAMLDSMMSMQLTGLARQLYMNDTPKPAGNRHPLTYPVDSFATRDGDIVIVCFSQQSFVSLCNVIGQPNLHKEPRFSNNAARNEHEHELRKIIADWSTRCSQQEAIDALLSANIPAAPVWDLKQLVASKHVAKRSLIVEGSHARLGSVPMVPQPVKYSVKTNAGLYDTPMLGQHTEELLRHYANQSDEDLASLKANGII